MSVSDSIRLFLYFYLKVGTAGPQVMITVSKFSIFLLSKKCPKFYLTLNNAACLLSTTLHVLSFKIYRIQTRIEIACIVPILNSIIKCNQSLRIVTILLAVLPNVRYLQIRDFFLFILKILNIVFCRKFLGWGNSNNDSSSRSYGNGK